MSEQGRGPRTPADDRTRTEARERRRRLLVVVLGGVAAAAVAVAVVVVAVGRHDGDGTLESSYDGPLAPTAREQYGAVAMARPGVATPVLDLYEDFQCPACRALERRIGGTLKQLAAEGRARVVYRPFQLFQQEPLMSNSRRAANAAACFPAGAWVRYHDKLYGEQPPEGDVGFRNQDLIAWGRRLGATGPEFADCVDRSRQIDQVEKASSQAGRAGVDATPFLALNGRRVDDDVLGSPDELRKAVAAVGGGRRAPGGARATGVATGRHQARP
ncbi:DsbA family protein [Actinomadura syzygii]|uniref:Thioredoxin domain-containing protein n=1 Tax=Actinomadura syzygii TaxID=1427538 RepID=A0A5D0TZT4_9ACTN|nr:thioredoxin domain-containing protein [Actinomadura syzygii]TYC11043.1 thioredoxin domain-containing protein [Actinomadura syzygii]